jgi:hypothetical protein
MKLLQTPLPDAPKDEFSRAVRTKLEAFEPVRLPSYTVQQLNDTTPSMYSGYLVRCSNGNSGAECLAFCDGFKWKIIDIGNEISL